ncbi:type II secretion system protein [Prosthecobacter sp.]|uniref:type II secretion system protein n=1 Tax=Prosthecobacter sp. TaxID=1965333 RepID=UPI0037842D0E
MFIHHAARSKSAFTLIEVIMALALIGFVLSASYGVASGTMQIGKSMSNARVAETRISNFVSQWRDYMETMEPGIQLTADVEKVARGASGNLFIAGGRMPFAWERHLQLADGVEFGVVRNRERRDLSLVVRHLKVNPKSRGIVEYETISELPILEGLKQMQWQFYEPEDKKWFSSWDPKKRPRPPLFMKLKFAFTSDPREHEYTFWIANDLAEASPPQAAPGPQ